MKTTKLKKIMLYLTAAILFATAIGVGGIAFAWLSSTRHGKVQTIKSGNMTLTLQGFLGEGYKYIPGDNICTAPMPGGNGAYQFIITATSSKDFYLRFKLEYSVEGNDTTRYTISDTDAAKNILASVTCASSASDDLIFVYGNDEQEDEDEAIENDNEGYFGEYRRNGYFYLTDDSSDNQGNQKIPGGTSLTKMFFFESVLLSGEITLETGAITFYFTVEARQAYSSVDWGHYNSILSLTHTYKLG